LDDYLDLVECYREQLPVIELDPNPYWTGFYASRPNLKRKCHELVERLRLVEWLASGLDSALAQTVATELESPWWRAVVSNHHDFITGTSPNGTVYQEQIPWLEAALERSANILGQIEERWGDTLAIDSRVDPASHQGGVSADGAADPPEDDPAVANLRFAEVSHLEDIHSATQAPLHWTRQGGLLQVESSHFRIELNEALGGCITSLQEGEAITGEAYTFGEQRLRVPSIDLISYADSGGLWRMGHEFRGGHLRERERASQGGTRLQVEAHGDVLHIRNQVELDGQTIQRTLWIQEDMPLLYGRVEGRAEEGRTVTLAFETGIDTEWITMAQPGGVVTRPVKKIYQPTFWPVQGFVHLNAKAGGPGLAIFFSIPTGVCYRAGGRLEMVALRNATREKAWGLLPLLGNPATGFEHEPYKFDYALMFTDRGDWRANRLAQVGHMVHRRLMIDEDQASLWQLAESMLEIESVEQEASPIQVHALKPASNGEGIILRLGTLSPPAGGLRLRMRHEMHMPRLETHMAHQGQRRGQIKSAAFCDARERDLEPLQVQDDWVQLRMMGAFASVRLIFE